jgi:hypothetical protein
MPTDPTNNDNITVPTSGMPKLNPRAHLVATLRQELEADLRENLNGRQITDKAREQMDALAARLAGVAGERYGPFHLPLAERLEVKVLLEQRDDARRDLAELEEEVRELVEDDPVCGRGGGWRLKEFDRWPIGDYARSPAFARALEKGER